MHSILKLQEIITLDDSSEWRDYYLTYDSGTFGTGDRSHSDGVNRFTVVLEQTGITSGNIIARRPDNPSAVLEPKVSGMVIRIDSILMMQTFIITN